MTTDARIIALDPDTPIPIGLVRCSAVFRLNGRPSEGFPVLLGTDGKAVEVVIAYLLERSLWQNASVGTLQGEAYVLKSWWEWLARAGLHWRTASDQDVRAWAKSQEARLSQRRNQDRLNVLARFYQFARTKLPPLSVGISTDVRRDGVDTVIAPEEVVRVTARGRSFHRYRTAFRYTTVRARVRGSRPTPSAEEVDRILDHLADAACPYTAARDYLCARWMADAGLRRQGVAGLTLTTLEAGLRDVGWQAPEGGIAALAGDPQGRENLRAFVDALRDRGRRFMFVSVTEKGKVRDAPLPLPLLLATLEYVWDQRHRMVQDLGRRNKPVRNALWLSKRTGTALSCGAISDKIKKAFNTMKVAGSGHRLRARFAQNEVAKSYIMMRARLGSAFTPEEVLLPVADALGHEDLSTLRSYLNGAVREEAIFHGDFVAVQDKMMTPLFSTIIDRIEKGDLTLLEAIKRLINQGK